MQHTIKPSFEPFDASAYRVGIVVAEFNTDITHQMLDAANKKLDEYGVKDDHRDIHFVAGSVEIPIVLDAMVRSKNYDCLIALGAIIRGETAHFEYVARLASEGILRVSLEHHIPIGFGVITTYTRDQALARIKAGADAAVAALQTAQTIKAIK